MCGEMRGWGRLGASRCCDPGRLCKVPVQWLVWPVKGAPDPILPIKDPQPAGLTSASCAPLHPLPFSWLLQTLLPVQFSILFSSSSGPPPPGSQQHPSYAVLLVLCECLLPYLQALKLSISLLALTGHAVTTCRQLWMRLLQLGRWPQVGGSAPSPDFSWEGFPRRLRPTML